MTLVLTEITSAGIVMAADSAITILAGGKIYEADKYRWRKLLRIPKIQAGVAYWGMIGAIVPLPNRFDEWLEKLIKLENYTDLSSFTDQLVNALNAACNNKPLGRNVDIGLHVAGYAEWQDGKRRPYFYHVHNGHGTMQIRHQAREMPDGRKDLLSVIPEWKSEPRKLFEKHQDFPELDKSLEENLGKLESNRCLIRNGDYFTYMVIWTALENAFNYLNLIPNYSIPRDPQNLGSRKGLLHTALETTIRIYRCSNQSKIIGGKVYSLGINLNGYLEDGKQT